MDKAAVKIAGEASLAPKARISLSSNGDISSSKKVT
jgi:hypothetical protein